MIAVKAGTSEATATKTPQAAPAAAPAQPSAPSGPPRDKAVVFSKVAQIFEILVEVDKLKLPVLIRYSRDGKAVRAVFHHLDIVGNKIVLSGISSAGEAFLAKSSLLKVEFILLAKKIVFASAVISRKAGELTMRIPDKIMAIERRNNVRFKVPASCPAFIEFPERRISFDDEGAPHYPRSLQLGAKNRAFLRIDDISLGGLGAMSRYPAMTSALKTGDETQKAVLYLPNNFPIPLSVTVRWSKKTTASDSDGRYDEFRRRVARLTGRAANDSDLVIKETIHRAGVQFGEVSQELDSIIRLFIRRVQQAESI